MQFFLQSEADQRVDPEAEDPLQEMEADLSPEPTVRVTSRLKALKESLRGSWELHLDLDSQQLQQVFEGLPPKDLEF